MKLKLPIIIIILTVSFIMTGCLTAQYKKYEFKFTSKTSGELKITYQNIYSTRYDDEKTVKEEVQEDYDELISDYINGEEVIKDYPNAKVKSKRLYEKNNQLWGEVIFEFDNIEDVKLYKYNKKSPFMFHLTDTYHSSNGKEEPEFIELVTWDKKAKFLELITELDEPEKDKTVSLLKIWKENK